MLRIAQDADGERSPVVAAAMADAARGSTWSRAAVRATCVSPVTFTARARPPGRPDRRRPLGDGGFAECSGLELEADVQGVPRGRPQRRRRAPGRAGQARRRSCSSAGMFCRGRGRARRHRALGLADRHGQRRRCRSPATTARIAGLDPPQPDARCATWTFDRGLPLKVAGPDAQRQDRRDRDRGAAHRPRGPAAGAAAMTMTRLRRRPTLPAQADRRRRARTTSRRTSRTTKGAVRGAVQPDLAEDHPPQQHRQGRRHHQDAAAADSPSVQPATLTFDLEFDTAEGDANGKPAGRARAAPRDDPPVRRADRGEAARTRRRGAVRVGHVQLRRASSTQLTEDLDYFSPDGMPLRAKVSVDDHRAEPRRSRPSEVGAGRAPRTRADGDRGRAPAGGAGPGRRRRPDPAPAALAQAGESVQQLLTRLGADPATWRSAMAGLDSPLALAAGAQVQLGAERLAPAPGSACRRGFERRRRRSRPRCGGARRGAAARGVGAASAVGAAAGSRSGSRRAPPARRRPGSSLAGGGRASAATATPRAAALEADGRGSAQRRRGGVRRPAAAAGGRAVPRGAPRVAVARERRDPRAWASAAASRCGPGRRPVTLRRRAATVTAAADAATRPRRG